MAPKKATLPSLADIQQAIRKSKQKKSNADLAVRAGASTLRGLHNAHVLLRQRNVLFADAKPLTVQGNILFGVQLALCAFSAYNAGSELLRRTKPNQPPRETDEEENKIDGGFVAGSLIGMGMRLQSARNGQVLFRKRQLSGYGRAYQVYAAGLEAVQLTLHVRAAAA